MKRSYNKPYMKTMRLCAAEQLLSSSDNTPNALSIHEDTAGGSEALSNEISSHDLWGNDTNSIW